jgi:hypothetical protein
MRVHLHIPPALWREATTEATSRREAGGQPAGRYATASPAAVVREWAEAGHAAWLSARSSAHAEEEEAQAGPAGPAASSAEG